MDSLLVYLGIAVVSVGIAYVIVNFAGTRLIVLWAQVDDWWSPYRILPPPGEFYILAHNTPDGPFAGIIESIEDANYDAKRDLFSSDPSLRENLGFESSIPGLAWVGLYKRFLVREFRYTKWEQKEIKEGERPEMELKIKVRGVYEGEKPPSYYRRYELSILIAGMEIAGNVTIDAILDMTVAIESPRRAFFFEGTWITKLHAAVRAAFREYAGDKTFEKIREEKAEGAEALVAKIKALSGERHDNPSEEKPEKTRGLRDVCGIYIDDVRFVEFEPVGSERMKAALQEVTIMEQHAKALKLQGEGERDRDIARAAGRKALVEALGSQGPAVAQAEAISEAKPDVVVLGGSGVTPAINVGGGGRRKEDKQGSE